MKKLLLRIAWYAAIVTAIVGLLGVGIGQESSGWMLVTVGGSVLAAFALADAWRVTRRKATRPIGGRLTIAFGAILLLVAIVVSSNVLSIEIPLTVRIATLATGAQAFLLAIDLRVSGASRSERLAVPFTGHVAVLVGTALVLDPEPYHPGAALLAYAVGFSALALHAFWMRQRANQVAPPLPGTAPSYWEGVLLLGVAIGVISAVVVSFTGRPTALVADPTIARTLATVAGIAAALALAALASPPWSPAVFAFLEDILVSVFQHAVAAFVLLNTLLLAAVLVLPELFLWILGGYLALLAVGVFLEYLMVFRARSWRNQDRDSPQESDSPRGEKPDDPTTVVGGAPTTAGADAPITVVVSAFNEANVLPESLDHNLSALTGAQFLVVPATKSTDETVAIAHTFRSEYPNRVRVIEGTTGSKAGDLNQVWDHVTTPYVLLLDADETVDSEFVDRGLSILREDETVGIVQGRKVAADPGSGRLARFVTVERQHSTWIDHPFMHDAFGAGHFAGSAAIFRTEVPPAIDGWSPEMLTEDIDLTLRLYLETDWRVKYVPEMVAREYLPATLRDLIRQRVRWARGWAQVTARYGWRLPLQGERLGWRRTAGLTWLLFTTVSTPLYALFPALLALWLVGFAPSFPLWIAVLLAVFLLPVRGISIGYAALRDPVIPVERTPKRVAAVLVYAYLWIPVGWMIQLHALYLQLAGAPRVWDVTRKVTGRTRQVATLE